MVEPLVCVDGVKGAKRPGFRVGRTIDAAGDASLMHESRAHHAGFKRHVDRTVRKAPASERGGRLFDGDMLCVRGGRTIDLTTVVAAGDHFAVAHHYRSDWHLAERARLTRLFQGELHEALVVGVFVDRNERGGAIVGYAGNGPVIVHGKIFAMCVKRVIHTGYCTPVWYPSKCASRKRIP